jgi:hypothetical protein
MVTLEIMEIWRFLAALLLSAARIHPWTFAIPMLRNYLKTGPKHAPT